VYEANSSLLLGFRSRGGQ